MRKLIFERPHALRLSNWRAWVLNFAGIVPALYVFMTDSLAAAPLIRIGWRLAKRQPASPVVGGTMQNLDASAT
jgi:hypothetical protein